MFAAPHSHSLTAYFRWLKKYWWLAALYVLLGFVLSFSYFKQHQKWFQAQVIFVVNPELFNLGLLRRSDDIVLSDNSADTASPLTIEPELRIARWLHSESFARLVTQRLFTSPNEDDYYRVRRHLHYFRYQNDRFHALHWSTTSAGKAELQLGQIMDFIEQTLQQERRHEITTQLERNALLLERVRDTSYRESLYQQREVLKTRAALINAKDFSFIQLVTKVTASPNPIFPQRVHVLLACMFFWMALGVSLLHFRLLRGEFLATSGKAGVDQ
ncbi:hypothetical protein PSI9734_01594 [Pseudidiomarina piscicola]|uniref:Uncharacterized protein n=1 Tax=Pseudidiomarina piscicola TaxID=2614830 RepID=A0A6S6WNN1_9GAMM|nr:hypothetical protein [Pseudidiomarina piscicola]CAB0151181.1 hypothetical protein PSI9734_01594 [Pseudidiomarina piscicola]VZT40687.1 hypothetical protein PSI9734_01594 [Pseudomonas aeruginosa]